MRVLLAIFLLLLSVWLALQTSWGQNFLARQLTKRLSKDLQAHVRIERVNLNLFNFNKMNLEGVLVEDRNRDTLLYAGTFQVRITDWFFFKDKAELKYVGLQDAQIYFNRTDSVWNYQFLEDYFSSPSTGSSKKKAGIEFDLKQVEMTNVRFVKQDKWLGSNLAASIASLSLNADNLSLSGKTIDVTDLRLKDPVITMYSYPGRSVAQQANNAPGAPAAANTKPEDWNISFGRIVIENGRFRKDIDSLTTSVAGFDAKHMDFSKINATINNIGWSADTIRGNIDLSTVERSGLNVKSLKAATTIHPQAMIFDKLYLETNNSVLRDYFAMRYDELSDMSDFLHKVSMEANFDQTRISSDDLAIFASPLKTWKKNIRINGDARGTVDALTSSNLEIWAGARTYINGSVSLIGLPDINKTLINLDAKSFKTTYNDAVNFLPAIAKIKTPSLSRISYLNFTGSYTGFINDFVTYGTIQTNLGNLKTDLNMKVPTGAEPVYIGKISTNGFQLGQFLNDPKLGIVDLSATVKGKGLDLSTMDVVMDGNVRRIQYDGYTYQNITVKGGLTNRLFNGDFSVKDPNADLSLKGLIDFTASKPVFKVTANVGHADLQALKLSPDEFKVKGIFDLDFQASTISDLLGNINIKNAAITRSGKTIGFDSLVVSSSYLDGQKRLQARSNEFNATITGDFDPQALPDAFTLFLSRYYPAYIKPPRYTKPQVFTVDITTGVVEDYLKLIDPNLSGLNNSHLTGSLNTNANTMTIDADIPHLQYGQYDFSDIQLKGSGDFNQLVLTGQTSNAQISDSVFFPQTTFNITARNDTSDISLTTTSNQAINQASLSARIQTFDDGATVVFNPSTFVLNTKTWTIEQGGELNFRRNTVVQGQLVIKESNQQIRVWTEPDDLGSYNNLRVAWENINLGDISPFISSTNKFEGLVSGEATVEDPVNTFDITADLHAQELRVDNDSLGRFDAHAFYDRSTGDLTVKGDNQNPEHRIELDVAMRLGDTANVFTDKISTKLTNFELKYLNRFLGTLFSNITGYVSGNFDIVGEGANRDFLTHGVRITDASFKVNFTQVNYTIDDAEFVMKKDTISLNNIRIRDSRRNAALVSGYIKHSAFSNMYYDLKVETESPNMELINTGYSDNQQFYGKARGAGTFVLLGPQTDMLMDIDIKASNTDSSSITLPPSKSRESGQANFMVERKYGREMTPQSLASATNLNYVIRLAANPKVGIEVQLDDLTGDAIRGRGTGNLTITSGTSAPLGIQGRYNISEGEYSFTFQSVFGKKFELKKGADNYIEWNGDPYAATVRLEALYSAKSVSFAPLATPLSETSGLSTIRDNVNVDMLLTGNLFKPEFQFNLSFPSGKAIYERPDFQFAIQQIQRNTNELYKQVTFLIVFNSFAPIENGTTGNDVYVFNEFTYNTISGLFFGQVNKQLNKILAGILPNNNFTLNLSGSLYNRNLLGQQGRNSFQVPNSSNLNLIFGLPIFNNRINLTFGGSLDVPFQGEFQQTVRLYPDINVEFLVNKTGSLRANVFYKQNLDFLPGNTSGNILRTRYGASFGYGRSFNTLKELFRKRPKETGKANQGQMPAPDTTSSR